jgi:hypothetical protein
MHNKKNDAKKNANWLRPNEWSIIMLFFILELTMPSTPESFTYSNRDIQKARLTSSRFYVTPEDWRRNLNPEWKEDKVTIADVSFLRNEKIKKPEKKTEEEKKPSIASLIIDSREKSGLNTSRPCHFNKANSELATNTPQVNVRKTNSTCSIL